MDQNPNGRPLVPNRPSRVADWDDTEGAEGDRRFLYSSLGQFRAKQGMTSNFEEFVNSWKVIF